MLNITGSKFEITPAIKSLIEKKFSRLVKHISQNIIKADVTLSLENLNNIAKGYIHIAGHDINAKGEAEDMYKAIDNMIDKLDRQIKKLKEKMAEHKE